MAERKRAAHFILSVSVYPGRTATALGPRSRHSSRVRYGQEKAHYLEGVVREEEVRTQGLIKARQQEVDGPGHRGEAPDEAVHGSPRRIEQGAAGWRKDLGDLEEHDVTGGGRGEGHVRQLINLLATPLAGR